ncbi:MAG: hypothetical protein K2P51_06160 [Rhabdochlamydiaceae bacterium]|nr:hypothetical protein [Rhabdochlamydiaceae bacterium]
MINSDLTLRMIPTTARRLRWRPVAEAYLRKTKLETLQTQHKGLQLLLHE